MSVPRFRRVNFGSYDNYIPVGDVDKKSWNERHFSLKFSKPKRPGKKWRSSPSELREHSLLGDIEKDDQKVTPMWMRRSLLKISEKPSAYLAARRKPPFFTGPQRTLEFTDFSGDNKQIHKREENQLEKIVKKISPKGSKTKLLDIVDTSFGDSDSESKGSGELKQKIKDPYKDSEPETEPKGVVVNQKDIDKKKKSKEFDIESSDSKNEKIKEKESRKKSKDLDKGSKKKSKDPDVEVKDTVKKDKDLKKKSRNSVLESSGSKKIEKDFKKKSKDITTEHKSEKKDKDSKKKSKSLGTESKDEKKTDKNLKKPKDLNTKPQNLKMEDKKRKEGDMESEDSNDSKKKSKESNVSKYSKKCKEGKIVFKLSDAEITKRESELEWETPQSSKTTLSLRSCIARQMLPRIGRAEIRTAPLPEAQWIQKLI